jgi:prepilin-type N-terminal cleavage/methylation domain-containing protein
METKKHKAGFTLIELLVVIAIIGVLSGVVLIMTRRAKEEAAVSKIAADAKDLTTQINIIRDDQELLVGELTGSWCTICAFNDTDPVMQQGGAIAANNAAWAELGFTSNAPHDPWGFPYLIDENEAEPGFDCGRMDTVMSAGANGILDSMDDELGYVPEPGKPINMPGSDDYLFALGLYWCDEAAPL